MLLLWCCLCFYWSFDLMYNWFIFVELIYFSITITLRYIYMFIKYNWVSCKQMRPLRYKWNYPVQLGLLGITKIILVQMVLLGTTILWNKLINLWKNEKNKETKKHVLKKKSAPWKKNDITRGAVKNHIVVLKLKVEHKIIIVVLLRF